jgi:hypothetical protein
MIQRVGVKYRFERLGRDFRFSRSAGESIEDSGHPAPESGMRVRVFGGTHPATLRAMIADSALLWVLKIICTPAR